MAVAAMNFLPKIFQVCCDDSAWIGSFFFKESQFDAQKERPGIGGSYASLGGEYMGPSTLALWYIQIYIPGTCLSSILVVEPPN